MATADRKDPLASFNFLVKIQNLDLGCNEISGLVNETTVIEYRNGSDLPTPHKLPGQIKYNNLVFKRGFTPNGKELRDWRMTVVNGKTERRSGTITLLDEGRKPALVWKFFEAWPSKLSGPAMNAKNSDVAVEELELAVEGVELE